MKLAVVGIIESITPIAEANSIQQARVQCGDAGTWTGVCGKDIAAGEAVTVFLQDALLPPSERWAFMEARKWRVKMSRFLGAPSECLIVKNLQNAPDLPVGTDLTEALGVTKFEKPLPIGMDVEYVGAFPASVLKTDEPNYQTLDWQALLRSAPWYASEKADGTSCTVWLDEQRHLHVASRNWELKETTASGVANVYWETAKQYDWSSLPPHVAAQFEVVGSKVQGNPMGITGKPQGRLFTLYDTVNRQRLPRAAVDAFAVASGISSVPILCTTQAVSTEDDLRALAAIRYANGKTGEGIVIRDFANTWSFKVISLEYKG
jgi:hypothetical protein